MILSFVFSVSTCSDVSLLVVFVFLDERQKVKFIGLEMLE